MDIPTPVPGMRPCCIKQEFRKTVSVTVVECETGDRVSTHTRCEVCGNNHYLMEVPPIPLGMVGAPIA